jgi:RNA ligase (TIGR02306 family)
MRKLATIRAIDDIRPIPDADAIEVATVGGWNVVVKKGEYKVGDFAIYFEIDSWIPHELAPFLSKGQEPRVYEGVKGERLKTVKLRGQVSQGLLLPLYRMFAYTDAFAIEGMDVTETLGILKYEKPVSVSLAGFARGNFPSFIPKTDQERIQNLKRDLDFFVEEKLDFEVTEKLDGTSVTIYRNVNLTDEGKEPNGVCSRNLDLKETEGNVYWNVAKAFNVHEILEKSGRNLAIQGEIVGQGIQGNQYKLDKHVLYVFDIYDIDNQQYFTPYQRRLFCSENGLNHVPVIEYDCVIVENDIPALLEMAEGASVINGSMREGLVFKCNSNPDISFKAISNKWLLKNE